MAELEEGDPIFLRPTTINVSSDVGTYYKIKYMIMVRRILKEKGGQPLLDRFLGGCFGHLLDWNPGSKCAMAVHHIVSRQIRSSDNGLWFFIKGSRVHFSEKDYALVTGLQFGESDFDVSGEHDLRSVEVFRKFGCGQPNVKVSTLVDLFDNFKINDPDGSLYLRVAHVIVLYGMLLGYEIDKNVADWVWALVNDLDRFNRFSWGAYTYQILSHYTYNCMPKNKYKLYGPVWALHVWSLEILPELAIEAGKCIDAGAHPRCLRWKFRTRPNMKDLRPIFEQEVQHLLELVPDDFEVTTTYYASIIGVHIERPVMEGQQLGSRPAQDIHVEEHEPRTSRVDRRARTTSHGEGSHRRDKGKRDRPPPNSSSSSSGDHVIRRRDRDYIDGIVRRMGEEQELRLRRQNEDLERRMKRTLKGFFDDLKAFFSCRVEHPRGVYSPAPRPTPAPETRDCDDVADEQPDAGDVSHHDDVPQSIPARHSVHELGSTSTFPTHEELPRFSLQNPSDYNADPMQGYMEIMGQGLRLGNMAEMGTITTSGITDLLMANFGMPAGDSHTPTVPRRSQRQRFPSRALESPFATPGEPRLLSKNTLDRFMSFLNGDAKSVIVTESNAQLPKSFFKKIIKHDTYLDFDVIEMFMMSCREKLVRRASILPYVTAQNTIISGLDLFRVCESYWRRSFLSSRLHHAPPGSFDSFADWEVPGTLVQIIKGEDGSTLAQSWMGASQIIVPCLISGHYVVVRIHPGLWQAELFDPLYFGLDEDNKIHRKEQLQPLLSLFSRVLDCAGYWASNELGLEKKTQPLDMLIMGPDDQFTQKDSSSCGPFACMVVERIISNHPSITWGNTRVDKYREIVAATIFDMCEVDV